MKNYVQTAANVDVFPLLFELQRQPELWNRNPCRLSVKGPHHETEDIILRYKNERPHIEAADWRGITDPHVPEWYESVDYLPASRPLIRNLMAGVQAEMLYGVFLYRIRPGKRIHPHTDTGWHAGHTDKFNICIASNPQTRFEWPGDDEAMIQRPGDIHWFRNDSDHQVINDGQSDHIVLTVCVRLDQGIRIPASPEGWTMDESQRRKHNLE